MTSSGLPRDTPSSMQESTAGESSPERKARSADALVTDVRDPVKEILRVLETSIKNQNKYRVEDKRKQEFDSLRGLCSMLAGVSIFLATLGATFLQYVRDSIEARGPPEKRSDHVIDGLLFYSMFLSMGATLCLGYAAGTSSRLGKTVPEDHALKMSPRIGAPSTSSDTFVPQHAAPPGSPASQSSPASGSEMREMRTSAWILGYSLSVMIWPLVCLLSALIVFVWAEKSRAVAVSVTFSLSYTIVIIEVARRRIRKKERSGMTRPRQNDTRI